MKKTVKQAKNSGKTTMMIKSKFSNQVHEIIEKELDKPNSKRTPSWRKPELTIDEKVKMFDLIYAAHNEVNQELGAYWFDRREKKRRDKARIERGWKVEETPGKVA